MIVDVHTHAPTTRERVTKENHTGRVDVRAGQQVSVRFSWDDHRKAMESVDKAFVIGYPTAEKERVEKDLAYVSMDEIAAYVRSDPLKMIGVMWLNPLRETAVLELEYGANELGLKAVKIGPIYDDFNPIDPVAIAFYRKVAAMGLPLLIHQATTFAGPGPRRLSNAKPELVESITHAVPELKIVIAHMGHPWYWDTVVLIRKEPSVYADISGLFYRPWQFYNALVLCMEYGQLDKLLFGSDFPVATPRESIEKLRKVNELVEGTNLPKIPQDQIDAILYRDSLEILGLEDC